MLAVMRWTATLLLVAALPAQGQQAAASIDVPAGAHVVLEAKGDGVQVYTCAAADGANKWIFQGPDAKLLDAAGQPMGIHFAGPTWKLSDGSEVQGAVVASQASRPGSVPWLLLRAKPGSGTGKLAEVAWIRRTETNGGVADPSGCTSAADAGKTVRVPYTATYTFYAEK
jgi:hypothetical protein